MNLWLDQSENSDLWLDHLLVDFGTAENQVFWRVFTKLSSAKKGPPIWFTG